MRARDEVLTPVQVMAPMKESGLVTSEDALRLQDWLEKGAFPAIDLGYIDQILFSVYDDHPSRSVWCL